MRKRAKTSAALMYENQWEQEHLEPFITDYRDNRSDTFIKKLTTETAKDVGEIEVWEKIIGAGSTKDLNE